LANGNIGLENARPCKLAPSKDVFTLGSKTKETPKLSDLMDPRHNYELEEFMSGPCSRYISMKWY
jgi:hypothetical protein